MLGKYLRVALDRSTQGLESDVVESSQLVAARRVPLGLYDKRLSCAFLSFPAHTEDQNLQQTLRAMPPVL